jgi:porin
MLCSLLWKGCVLTILLSCTFASARPQSQSPEDGLSGADQSEHAANVQPHLFGEWNGKRTKLYDKGVRFDLAYTSDSLWNVRSAKEERVAVWDRVRGTVDLDFSRLTDTPGLTFHITAVWQGGGNLGTYLGTITGPSGMASENSFRLDSWWMEKRILGERLIVRAGQFAGQDFYGTQLFAPSFIFEPLQYAFGNLYASTYENFDPPSTPAAEVRVIPAAHFYIKYMVSAAVRNPYNYNPTGFVPQFHGNAMSLSEIGYSPGRQASAVRAQDNVEARKGYAGLYRFGAAYNPGKFASTSSNKPVSGNYLIYGSASQALYRTDLDTDRGIDLTAGADWTPPDRTRNNQDLTIGLRLNEPLPISLHNTMGVAYVRSGINQSFPVSSPPLSANPAEHAFEVNLLLELPHAVFFQPVVQYYMNCGGSSQNAVVLGFHTKIVF